MALSLFLGGVSAFVGSSSSRPPRFRGDGLLLRSTRGETVDLVSLAGNLLKAEPSALAIAQLCDIEDDLLERQAASGEGVDVAAGLAATRLARRRALERLLAKNRPEYLETAAFLGERIPRAELPNREGLSVAATSGAAVLQAPIAADDLVEDCQVRAAPPPNNPSSGDDWHRTPRHTLTHPLTARLPACLIAGLLTF